MGENPFDRGLRQCVPGVAEIAADLVGAGDRPAQPIAFEMGWVAKRVYHSFKAGFDDADHIERDTDLDSIRDEPGYRRILGTQAPAVNNGQAVTSKSEYQEATQGLRSGSLVRLYVYRAQLERSSFVILRVP